MRRPIYYREEASVRIEYEAGWTLGNVWTIWRKFSSTCRESTSVYSMLLTGYVITASRKKRWVRSILGKALQDYLWSFFCLEILLINRYYPETVSFFLITLLRYIAILPSLSSLLLFICFFVCLFENYLMITETWYRDNVVGIATCHGLDSPGFESRWERDFPHVSKPDLRTTQPPVQWVLGLSRR